MVQQANTNEARAWGALPSRTEMGLRRISSVALMAGLLTVTYPFTPFGWVFPSGGPELLDNFLAWPLLLGALFFQWRIAGVVGTLTVQIADFVTMYQHAMYWKVAGAETALIVAVNLGKHELWRRFAGVGIVGGLWAIGWAATPLRYKMEAWEHLKWIWTCMAINEVSRGWAQDELVEDGDGEHLLVSRLGAKSRLTMREGNIVRIEIGETAGFS